LAAEGATEAEIVSQQAFVEALLAVIDDPDGLLKRSLRANHSNRIQALPEISRHSLGDIEQYARTMAQQAAQQYGAAWFGSFLSYDPAQDWAQTMVRCWR